MEIVEEQRLNRWLWVGLLSGPLAWGLQLQTSYSLTETACATGHQWLLHLVGFAAVLVPVASGLLAARLFQRLPEGSTGYGDDLRSRARFMALSGIVMSAFFVLVNLAMWIPSWILGACAH
jgi:hypothetical protein